MNTIQFYALLGAGLFCLGLYALIIHAHLLRKILALNIMASGIFMVLIALAKQADSLVTDAVPHAMVITGIVVAVSATALALVFVIKLVGLTGRCDLSQDKENDAAHH